MENNEVHISNMTIFTTALCNLNCGYCYICKDTVGCLKQIDKDLEADLESLQQIKQCFEVDPDADKHIESLTLWGGEPFLKVERFTNKLEEYFKAFPKLKSIDTSTNFTVPNEVEKIEMLLNKIASLYHGKEPFSFDLQISIDGYEEMNDFGRGEGVTKKYLENFEKLCQMKYNSQKIALTVHTKATSSKETMHFLETEEQCYKWFKFFDEKMFQVHKKYAPDWTLGLALFNHASPTEWTKDDGIKYKHILENFIKIQPMVKKLEAWERMDTIIPEAFIAIQDLNAKTVRTYYDSSSYAQCGGGCGAFCTNLVPITNGKYTMCHRGLFDDYVEYFNNSIHLTEMNGLSHRFYASELVNEWIYDKDELLVLKHAMDNMIKYPSKIRYTDYLIFIREYARSGIIDKRWMDPKELEKTFKVFMNNSYCLQDSYIFTGSWSTMATLETPLLYNGAMDIILDEIERIVQKEEERMFI